MHVLLELHGLAQMRPVGGVLEVWIGVWAQAGRQDPAIYVVLGSRQCGVLQINESTSAAPLLFVAYSSNPLLETAHADGGRPVSPTPARQSGYLATDVLAEAQWERSNGITSAHVSAIGLYGEGGEPVSTQCPPVFFLTVYGRCIVTFDVRTFATIDTRSASCGYDETISPSSRILKQRISQSFIVCAFTPVVPLNSCGCAATLSSSTSKAAAPAGTSCGNLHLIFANTSGGAGIASLAPCFLNQAVAGDGPTAGVGVITPSSMIDLVSRQAEEGNRVTENSPLSLVARVAAQSNGIMYVHSQSGSLLAQLTLAGSNFSLENSDSAGVQSVFQSVDNHKNSSTRRSNAALASLKVGPLVSAAAVACQLRTGREARLAKLEKKIQKRRTSMIASFTKAPTELSEIYAKTRAPALVELTEEDEEDEEDEPGSSGTSHAGAGASDAASSMREAQEAMQKRGEMLTLLAAKGEAMAKDTEDFRAQAKAKRKQLEAKSKRWGF